MLLPIGVALGSVRGVCSVGEHILVPHVGNFVAASVRGNARLSEGATELRAQLQSTLQSDSSLGSILRGTGASGFLARTSTSIFLPATDVLIDGVVESVTSSPGGDDLSTLVRASCDGVVKGHIAKVRDTASGLGALAFFGVATVAVAADRAVDSLYGDEDGNGADRTGNVEEKSGEGDS